MRSTLAPPFSASFAKPIECSVEDVPTPAMTGTLPAAASTAHEEQNYLHHRWSPAPHRCLPFTSTK